ncbi:hypothetical protein GCM10025776_05470 [Corallincola platygyrae]
MADKSLVLNERVEAVESTSIGEMIGVRLTKDGKIRSYNEVRKSL